MCELFRAVYWPGDYDSRFLLSVFTPCVYRFSARCASRERFVRCFFCARKNKDGDGVRVCLGVQNR